MPASPQRRDHVAQHRPIVCRDINASHVGLDEAPMLRNRRAHGLIIAHRLGRQPDHVGRRRFGAPLADLPDREVALRVAFA